MGRKGITTCLLRLFRTFCVACVCGLFSVNAHAACYKLALNANGGTAGSTTTLYTQGNTGGGLYTNSVCSTPYSGTTAKPTRSGYTFLGYFSTSKSAVTSNTSDASVSMYITSSTGSSPNTIYISSSRTLYAAWAKDCSISNGTCSVANNNYTYNVQYSASCNTGYSLTSGSGTSNPICTPNCNKITLNKNGGSGGTTTVYKKSGSTAWYSNSTCTTSITTITKPTKTGYTFEGYYTSTSGGTQRITSTGSLSSYSTTSGETLYAQWLNPNIYTVTINNTTGYGFTNPVYIAKNSSSGTYVVHANLGNAQSDYTGNFQGAFGVGGSPTAQSREFTGLYTASSGGALIVKPDRTVTNSGTFEAYCSSKSCTLYTHWQCKDGYTLSADGNSCLPIYTITYDNNDGSGCSSQSGVLGTALTCAPTKTGYTFKGWYTAATGGTEVTTITGTTTVYAHWTPNMYTVTLDNQGATSAGTTNFYYQYKTNSPCYYYTSSTSFTQSTCMGSNGYTITKPTRTGYKFDGYFTGTNGTGTQYVDADGTCINNIYSSVASDKTLYAKWTPNIYQVTLEFQGGSGEDATPYVYEKYGDNWYLHRYDTQPMTSGGTNHVTIPTRTGYTFNGYYTAPTGGFQAIKSSGAKVSGFSPTLFTDDNGKFYAQWTQCRACSAGTSANCTLSVVNNVCTYTTSCRGGYYNITGDGTYNPSCSPVTQGYYSPDGDGKRYKCTDFRENTTTTGTNSSSSSDCVCTNGYYLNSSNKCIVTEEGYYSGISNTRSGCSGRNSYSGAGASSCSAPGDGYYTTGCDSSGNKCTGRSQCTSGNYCKSGVSTACTTTSGWTTASAAGSSAYTACYQTQTPANCSSGTIKRTASGINGTTITYGSASVTTALSANAGSIVDGQTCTQCSAGYYSAGGTATSCSNCASANGPNGRPQYSGAGASSCTECPAVTGTYASRATGYSYYPSVHNNGANGCFAYFTDSDSNATFRTLCYYSSTDGTYGGANSTCQIYDPFACAAGYYLTISSRSEWSSAGSYASCKGVDCMKDKVCTPVGDGYYSGTDSLERTQCPAGYRDGPGTTAQSNCTASCAAGTRVASANAACSTPAGGWYTGAHTVNYGQISPVNYCMAGFSSSGTSVSNHDASTDCIQSLSGKAIAANTISARYIKVTTTGSTANGGSHVVEIQAFAARDGTGTNLLSGKTGPSGSNLANATDGSWNRSSYAEGTMVWDMGAVKEVGSIKFALYTDGRTYHNVNVYVSTDNSNWTTVFTAADLLTQNISTAKPEMIVLSAAPTNCSAGTYKAAYTATLGTTYSCSGCGDGQYQNESGKTSCKACSSLGGGLYTKSDGSRNADTTCYISTTAGKYLAAKTDTAQTTCPVKNYCPSAKLYYPNVNTATACPAADSTTARTTFPDSYLASENLQQTGFSQQSWTTGITSKDGCMAVYSFSNNRGNFSVESVKYNSTTGKYDTGGGPQYYTKVNPGYYLSVPYSSTYCNTSTNRMLYQSALSCPTGSYCPGYTSVPLCNSGLTYGDDIGITGCPSNYSNSAAKSDDANDCYLTTTAGSYVATAGSGQTTCAAGGYCPGGSIIYKGGSVSGRSTTGGRTACSAGYYNGSTGSSASSACSVCAAGKYSSSGSASCSNVTAGYYNTGCGTNATGGVCSSSYSGGTIAAGYYGGAGATSSTGSGKVSAGYYSSGGGTSATPTAAGNGCISSKSCGGCSGRNSYSGAGASSCSAPGDGYYTTGCDSSGNKCTGRSQCTSGNYCKSGVSTACTTTSGWTTASAAGSSAYTACYQTQTPANCSSGTIKRTASSISGTTITYGSASVTSALSSPAGYYVNSTACSACGGNNYYCAGGTAERKTVSSGYYSTGGTSTTRTGQSQCKAGSYCSGGVQYTCPDPSTHKPTSFPSSYYNNVTITSISISGMSDGATVATDCRVLMWFDTDRASGYEYPYYNGSVYEAKTPTWSDVKAGYYLTDKSGCGSYAYYATVKSCPEGYWCPGKTHVSCDASNQSTVHTTNFGLNACNSLSGVSVTGGTYTSAAGSTASTACKYTAPSKSITGCASVTTNTVTYNGSAWPATTYSVTAKPNYYASGASCIACPTNLVSPQGAIDVGSCGRKLHIGDQYVYLRSEKKTTPSLNIDIDNDGAPDFFGNMSTTETNLNSTSNHKFKIQNSGQLLYLYDDTISVTQ